jgi:exopolysaccharide biosynthesis polyprenyl glycosylphosphotransferase
MATSEYIRKSEPSERQPKRFVYEPAKSRRQVAGPGFDSKLLRMAGDVIIVIVAFALALEIKLRFFDKAGTFRSLHSSAVSLYLGFFAWFLCCLLLVSEHYDLYNPVLAPGGLRELRVTVQASLNAGLLLCGGLYMARLELASRTVVVLLVGTTTVALCIWRASIRLTYYRHFEKGIDTRNVVILGTNQLSQALGEHIAGNYRLGYQFLGYISASNTPASNEGPPSSKVLGSIERLRQLTRLHFIDEVVIAHALPTEQVILLLEEARELGIEIRAISGLYGDLSKHAGIEYLGAYPVTPLHRSQSRTFALFFKRITDILFSLAIMIAVFPFMFLIAVMIRLDSEGPVFYISERIGKRGRVFPCFKFRTMVKDAEKRKRELAAMNERDGILFKVSNDPRVTRVGRILRKYSLDELPQFFNVFRGEMSVVGPRPPIASEVEKYELEHFRRLEVMPGLTGLWQVHARQDSSFAKYIELDTAYVENWTFWLDVKILLRTAHVVLRGTGA